MKQAIRELPVVEEPYRPHSIGFDGELADIIANDLSSRPVQLPIRGIPLIEGVTTTRDSQFLPFADGGIGDE
jgi:hypothetical protein